jgi:hypothetical protein
MKTYIVQATDTPMTIAHRFTGNRERYSELIAANPQKGLAAVPHGLAGPPTFDSLHVGEQLNLPRAWGLGILPGSWKQLTTQSEVAAITGTPYWAGYFCGVIDNQAGISLFRNPSSGLVCAQAGPSINYPDSPIEKSFWLWSGTTPAPTLEAAAQLPVIPGMPCVTPQWVYTSQAPSGGGAVLASGGGFNTTTPHPSGPQHTM